MELEIKPLEKCNFNCTFCGSTHISNGKNDIVELSRIEQFLDRFPNTKTISISGGEPLLLPPSYYETILEMANKKLNQDFKITITSNLWVFFKNPEPWKTFFSNKHVTVRTSFQYGSGRLKDDNSVFTESEFIAISDLFLKMFGYRPDFNAVILKENYHTVIDTVKLAKRLDVVAKINYADYAGRLVGQIKNVITLGEMYQQYVRVYELGLSDWEHNTQLLDTILIKDNVGCPVQRNCDDHKRLLQPNGYFTCAALGDTNSFPINFIEEIKGEQKEQPLAVIQRMKRASCFACPMNPICNGCKSTVNAYQNKGLVERHCSAMRKVAPAIIEINGLSESLKLGPLLD